MNRIAAALGLAAVSVSAIQCADAEREFKVNVGKDNKQCFKIETMAKVKDCKDRLEFELNLHRDGAEVDLDVRSKVDVDKGKDIKAAFRLRQKVFSVIEFEDKNNNNVVDDGETIQTLKIGGEKGWTNCQHDETSEGVHEFSSTADWFGITARYAGTPTSFDVNSTKIALKPDVIKVDYMINEFPYQGNNTKLAIDGRFKSKSKFRAKKELAGLKPDQDQEEFAVNDDGDAKGAKFRWVKTVWADGVEVDVVGTSPTDASDDDEIEKKSADESNKKVVWVFAKAGPVKSFLWDPEVVGTEDNGDANAATSLVAGAAGFVAAALFA